MGLLRILFFIGAGVVTYLIFQKLFGRAGRDEPVEQEDARLGRLVQDPQCKVYVDSKDAVKRKVPDGALFFCSEACAKDYFEAGSEKGA